MAVPNSGPRPRHSRQIRLPGLTRQQGFQRQYFGAVLMFCVDGETEGNGPLVHRGYSVVQAESHDAATKIFGKDHPHLQMPGAWIEIIEIMPMPGM